MQDFYGKQYKLNKSEKFDEYIKVMGVGMMTRKLGGTVSPVIELTEADGVYTLKFITHDGNKLIHIQKGKPKNTEIIRELSPEQELMTLKVDDIVCTQIYKVI